MATFQVVIVLLAVAAVTLGSPQTRPTQSPSSTTSSTTTQAPAPSITRGEFAGDGEIPYYGLLFNSKNNSIEGFNCGGALIDPMWVLTAAHCFGGTDRTLVSFGSTDKYDMSYVDYATQRITHENYNQNGNYNNDIALLKLPRPATGMWIETIEMASVSDGLLEGEPVLASGFGRTTPEPGSGSDDLLKVNLRVISNQVCNDSVKVIEDSHICTTYTSHPGEGPCSGDSGGPLAHTNTETGKRILVGVVSVGIGCDTETPEVYMRVSSYRDWIQRKMDENP